MTSTSSRYAEAVETPAGEAGEDVTGKLRLVGQIHRLSLLLARPFQQHFAAEHGVSLPEWRVLVQVVRRPGIAGSQVAAATGLTAMGVSRAVHSLRGQGLIDASTDPTDTRRNLLRATEEGAELYRRLAPFAVRDIADIMSAFTPAELDTFEALLTRLNARTDEVLAQERGTPPPRG